MSASAARYELTSKAEDDLDGIWRHGAETWSPDQADLYLDDLVRTFETLAAMLEMARERTELSPPVRIHDHGMHLIVYVAQPERIVIIRVLGGRQDWKQMLERMDG